MSADPAAVYIVLATYNGEAFLQQQLKSLQQQSFGAWRLLVSDDGSSDATLELLRNVEDERIELLPRRSGEPGHAGNFEYLLSCARERGADWVFLADQDDLWQPHKLQTLLDLAVAGNPPQAIYSDLELVDAVGAPHGSYLETVDLVGRDDVASLLQQNLLVGCSMVVNRSLLELALPFPLSVQNHDWWLGLCAAAAGSLTFCPQRLVHYRQHGDNAIGLRSPLAQLPRFNRILRRQQRVFAGKRIAVPELEARLRQRGLGQHAALSAWCREFQQGAGLVLAQRLARSRFRPRSVSLALVQCLALLSYRE